MQTEPIGFKGTKGDFFYKVYPASFNIHLKDHTTICDVWKDYYSHAEKEADTKLMTSSKKMAIALQQICELPQTIGHAYEMQKIAKEALKEAGLSPDQ